MMIKNSLLHDLSNLSFLLPHVSTSVCFYECFIKVFVHLHQKKTVSQQACLHLPSIASHLMPFVVYDALLLLKMQK